MRLLSVYNQKFSEFDDKYIPSYAITSHRWSDDEACFKDIRKNKNRLSEGMKKVEGFCQFVRDQNSRNFAIRRPEDVCNWIWLDTVCINKDSASEVAESINSMFRWYRRAQVCYAYLADVRPLSAGREAVMVDFRKSNWFTRGWTLQELIAPRQVVFLTSSWEVIGMTRKPSPAEDPEDIGNIIADVTGIPRPVFGDREQFHLDSLTPIERSQWIRRRETTKIEDIAYCLLGILDVNMGLIYGERGKAWQRLEEEVSKRYKTPVTLPPPDALNKRASGFDFPSWFRSSRSQAGPENGNSDDLTTIAIANEAPQTEDVVSPAISMQAQYPLSHQPSPDTSAIPMYHPSKLGEDLLKTSADGDVPNLELLLSKAVDVNYRDRSGFTALHHAVLHGHEVVASMLVAYGADINAQSLELGPPLCLAALRGRVQVVQLLLGKDAQVNQPGRWTGSPLHCACWSGSYDAAAVLLTHGASTTFASTIWATFLEYGSSLGSSSTSESKNPTRQPQESSHEIYECQPLIIAAHRRHEAIVQLLITSKSSGFSINMEHRFWWSAKPDEESFANVSEDDRCEHETALMAASWKGPRTLLSTLLAAGAVVNKRDSWGRFALWMAAQSGKVANVQVLVEAGAEVNAVSNSGKSSLHVAIEDGYAAIVAYLIEQGADVDRADNNGRTACHFAAFKGNVEILEMLLSRNARYSARDKDDRTPLHAALTVSNHLAAVECLLKYRANPLAPDKDGRTPLHYAANRGSPAVVLLLDAGADATIEDTNGRKAFAYLPAKTSDTIRRRLTPTPFGDKVPRLLRRDSPLATAGGVDVHGRSLSDSSVNAVANSSRKNSQDGAEIKITVSPVLGFDSRTRWGSV